MTKKTLVMVAIVVIGMSTLLAAVGKAPAVRKVTVGEFVNRLAVEMGKDASDPAAAATHLKGLGVNLAADLDAPLTDGVVNRIAADLGMRINPSVNPSSQVSEPRAAALSKLMGDRYFVEGGVTTIDDPPTQCLTSENRGTCVECCKEASGESGKYCGRFCHDNVPPGESDPEPTP